MTPYPLLSKVLAERSLLYTGIVMITMSTMKDPCHTGIRCCSFLSGHNHQKDPCCTETAIIFFTKCQSTPYQSMKGMPLLRQR